MGKPMASPDAVASALESVEPSGTEEQVEQWKARQAELRDLVEKAKSLVGKLLPVERATEASLRERIAHWTQEMADLTFRIAGYRLLDPSVLDWRDREGWPRLALFSLDVALQVHPQRR